MKNTAIVVGASLVVGVFAFVGWNISQSTYGVPQSALALNALVTPTNSMLTTTVASNAASAGMQTGIVSGSGATQGTGTVSGSSTSNGTGTANAGVAATSTTGAVQYSDSSYSSGTSQDSYSAGCTSYTGYSTTTGLPCNSGLLGHSYVPGCTSFFGYSTTTGQPCNPSVLGHGIPNPVPSQYLCQQGGPASLKIVSPNGGQIYQAGQQITISWASCNISPANQAVRVDLDMPSLNSAFALTQVPVNNGSVTVTLPTTTSWTSMVYGNNFKIELWLPNYTGNNAPYSDSANLFTINGAPQGTINPPLVVESTSTVGTTTGVIDAAKTEYKFSATGTTATIVDLGFKDAYNQNAMTRVRVGNVTSATVSGKTYLYGVNVPVPNGNGGAFVDAYTSYAPVGPSGITTTTTGDINSELILSYIKVQSGNTITEYCANGDSPTGGNCAGGILSYLPEASGQVMTIVGSSPTVTVTPPNSSVLTPGMVEAIDVTVTANAAGPITLNSIPVTSTLSATGGSPSFGSQPIIVKDANNIIIPGASGSCTGGTTCYSNVSFTSGYLLPAGTTQTFKVYVPIQSVGTGQLPNTYMYSVLEANNGFQWTDTAGNAQNASQGNVTAFIYAYPSSTVISVHN